MSSTVISIRPQWDSHWLKKLKQSSLIKKNLKNLRLTVVLLRCPAWVIIYISAFGKLSHRSYVFDLQKLLLATGFELATHVGKIRCPRRSSSLEVALSAKLVAGKSTLTDCSNWPLVNKTMCEWCNPVGLYLIQQQQTRRILIWSFANTSALVPK